MHRVADKLLARRQLLFGTAASVPLSLLAGCGGTAAAPSPALAAPPPVANQGNAPSPPPALDQGMPLWARNVPLWTWTRIPNTKLSSVPPAFAVGITGPASKIIAWCGAGFSRTRMAYIIAAAGGHGDYLNNEVNAAFLGNEPRWEVLRASSPPEVMRNAVAYEDGRRGAVHTYRSTQHIDRLDRTFLFNSDGPDFYATYNGGTHAGKPYIMAFNHATGDWDPPTRWAAWPGSPGTSFINALTCKHPVTEAVYVGAGYDRDAPLRKFDPDRNSWSVVMTGLPAREQAAIDPASNRLFAFGDYGGTALPLVVDLGGGSVSSPSFRGLGADALRTGTDGGVVFDEVNRTLILFPSQSSPTILRIRVDDLLAERVIVAGADPGGRLNGWQNSWQYVPILKGIVCAASYQDDMLYLRTAE